MSKISAVIRAIVTFDFEQMANIVKKGGGDEFLTCAITLGKSGALQRMCELGHLFVVLLTSPGGVHGNDRVN